MKLLSFYSKHFFSLQNAEQSQNYQILFMESNKRTVWDPENAVLWITVIQTVPKEYFQVSSLPFQQ